MGKKFMRMVLLCFTLAAVLTVGAAATGARIIKNGECGGDLTWTLDEEGTLTISGTGDMTEYSKNWRSSTAPWKNDASSIKSIVIERGVTSISDYAFYYCQYLERVSIPDTVDTIGICAFSSCKELLEVTLPDNVVHMYDHAFSDCYKLTSVTLSKNLEEISEGAFENCKVLTNILIPENVTVIGKDAFQSCSHLQYLTFTSGLKEIKENAFHQCDRLSDVFYTGSRSDWEKVTIVNVNSDNYDLIYAKNHYYDFSIAAKLITLNETDIAMDIGNSTTLTPTFYPEGIEAEPLRWASSDSNIAEVTNGTVLAKHTGTAVITAKTLDGRISASCELSVTAPGLAGTFRVNWITIRNNSGRELYEIPTGKFLTTVSVTNETSSENPLVFVAAYTAEGQYQGMMYVEVKADPGGTVEVTLPVDNSGGKISQLKAFAVTSFDNLAPLGVAVSFPAA